MTRSMRQRRASSINGLVPSEETPDGRDKAYLRKHGYVDIYFLIKKYVGIQYK
jgi:hypothetical protein